MSTTKATRRTLQLKFKERSLGKPRMRWYSLVPEDITEKGNECEAILRLGIPIVFKWNEKMNEYGTQ
jgi:hypothetical protein